MTTPAGLVGAALLFWGWETGLFPLAVALAVVLEAPRVVAWRWDLAPSEQNRVADLSTFLFMALAVYLAVTGGMTRAALRTLEWLPLSLVPLMAVQSWSSAQRISLTALFWSRRRANVAANGGPPPTIDLGPIYAAVCVLSASVPNHRGPAFYVGVCALAAWTFWRGRSPAHSRVAWCVALGLAATLGWIGHVALNGLQAVVERFTAELYVGGPDLDADPYRSVTAIGAVGALKLSERIVLRVDPGDGVVPPLLLHETTYTTFSGRAWLGGATDFTELTPSGEPPRWTLVERAAAGTERAATGTERAAGARQLDLSTSLKRGRAVLALPGGAVTLEGVREGTIKRTSHGAVRVDGGPGVMRVRVDFVPDAAFAAPPTEADLKLSRNETAALARVVEELDLAGREPRDVVETVRGFFRERFRYTTFLARGEPGATPLSDFLQRARSGHCEYFATATALLLRAAGVPARYATGYSVQEWSRLEQRWIVRARHAHAWTLVWLDDAWRDLDTTPPEWVGAEGRDAPAWEPFADLTSWIGFQVSRAFASETGSRLARHVWWLLLPLGAWVVWRFAPRRGGTRARIAGARAVAEGRRPGSDSEFYAIERALGARGFGRRPDEPVPEWLRRITDALPAGGSLRTLARLHCRYRFDPDGLRVDERRALKDGVEAWLATASPRVDSTK